MSVAMVGYATKNRIVPAALSLCVCLALFILGGCKKKEPSAETRRDGPAKETPRTYAYEPLSRAGGSEKSDLRILYAGLLDTNRARDFVAFLAAHFERVETTDYLTLKGDESAGFDVTIIDRDGVSYDEAALFKVSPEYAHAAIVVGVPGAFLCQGLKLATGYQ